MELEVCPGPDPAVNREVSQTKLMNDTSRIALVTGGARGIGRAIALALAQPGLTIYLNDVVLGEEAVKTQQEVEAKGAAARLVEFNVADAAAVNQGLDHIIKESGRLDILVNNAGIPRDNLIVRMKETDWDAVLGRTSGAHAPGRASSWR